MSDLVKFKWNGKEIEAPKGSNLLKAALDNGIEVAHYCYHAGLSVAGVCRMCMVEQEGVPRPFPACNATVAENMIVRNDTPKIQSAVEGTLQFHLVNHPLDCPVCDQAGECGLQDYYMKHGKYDSNMIDKKVHKEKVQDIGRGVMLDAERCILCSRCVRFTNEITKTNEMGILNRGDHAEITVNGKLDNDYAQNLVDICPVGALTSKDFRFKQRVWFLEELHTSCVGCEALCSIKVSQNKNGAYRVKPVFDEKVNGHFICDEGREVYKHTSGAMRLNSPLKSGSNSFVPSKFEEVKELVKSKSAKFILSTFLTNEEYLSYFEMVKDLKVETALYELPSHGPEFDGILKRGNKNPNLKGAQAIFSKYNCDSSKAGLDKTLNSINSNDVVFIVVPEMIKDVDNFKTLLSKIAKAQIKIGLCSTESLEVFNTFDYLLPIPCFTEKDGTMTNFNNLERKIKKGMSYGENSHNVTLYAGWMN